MVIEFCVGLSPGKVFGRKTREREGDAALLCAEQMLGLLFQMASGLWFKKVDCYKCGGYEVRLTTSSTESGLVFLVVTWKAKD